MQKTPTRRKTPTRASLKKAQLQSNLLEEELKAGVNMIDKIRRQRDYMIAEVKQELKHQSDLRAKIEYLKKEYKLLVMSQTANQKILEKTRGERAELESEVRGLENQLDQLKGKKKSLVVTNDFGKLIEVMNLDGNSGQKEKSVLLTCLRDIIRTTEENEFEGIMWKAKFAKNPGAIGARIRFDRLSMTKQDMQTIYGAMINGLSQKFKKYELKLQTRTKSANGVVTSIDIVLRLPLYKEVQTNSRPQA